MCVLTMPQQLPVLVMCEDAYMSDCLAAHTGAKAGIEIMSCLAQENRSKQSSSTAWPHVVCHHATGT